VALVYVSGLIELRTVPLLDLVAITVVAFAAATVFTAARRIRVVITVTRRRRRRGVISLCQHWRNGHHDRAMREAAKRSSILRLTEVTIVLLPGGGRRTAPPLLRPQPPLGCPYGDLYPKI
jgi:hypothetical protein